MDAKQIIDLLELKPHPEGGFFVQTFEDEHLPNRAHSTAIYYLLEAGQRSHWHRVDAAEVWHFYAGAPLDLDISADGHSTQRFTLGNNLQLGERPQVVVPKGHWQSAQSRGDWTLVGCTVAPGFQFSGFEMASPHWQPGP